MNIVKVVWTCLAVAFYAMAAVAAEHEHDHEHAHAHGHDHAEHGHDHHGDHLPGPEVQVGVRAQKLIGIKTVRVAERRLGSSVDLRGRFVLAPSAQTIAISPVAGTVALQVKAYQKVRRGDVLFTVSSPDLRMRTAEIAVLESRLAGYSRNGAKNAGLKAELDLRRAERAALVGTAIETNGVVTVLSKVDGVVTRLVAPEGA